MEKMNIASSLFRMEKSAFYPLIKSSVSKKCNISTLATLKTKHKRFERVFNNDFDFFSECMSVYTVYS